MSRAPSVTVRAPAKVNLQLSVGAPRADGYHDLATVFHAVSIYDEVTVAPAADLTLTVSGESAHEVPTDDSNLAARAVVLLAKRVGRNPDVALHITKSIPVAGGMAGGSADAAAALVACDALWGSELERGELLDLARRLGSDVPFPVVGGTAIGLGRGERLTPVLARGTFDWVFALAHDGLSTPVVYAETDRLRAGRILPQPRPSEALMAALRAGDAQALGRALYNDLQPASCTLRPELRMTLAVGEDAGALGSMVSGSGPTVAFLCRNREHALDVAVALGASGACAGVKRAHGPVHGARLVDGTPR